MISLEKTKLRKRTTITRTQEHHNWKKQIGKKGKEKNLPRDNKINACGELSEARIREEKERV